jgi:uncharacterized membrane protein
MNLAESGEQTQSMGTGSTIPRWLWLSFALLLVLGIGFRVVNIDRKVYWVDEVYTSLRMAGYTETEFTEQVFTGAEWTATDLMTYQIPTPARGWDDTLNALRGNAEHAPLYFLLARAWTEWWCYSVASIRSLSVLFSLLMFPAGYWLCRELRLSPLVTGITLSFIALSPLHVLYAQEARQYSLWTLWIVLSSAVLLWALRCGNSEEDKRRSPLPWLIYSLTVALGLYTHLLFGLVIVTHAVYVVILTCSDRGSRGDKDDGAEQEASNTPFESTLTLSTPHLKLKTEPTPPPSQEGNPPNPPNPPTPHTPPHFPLALLLALLAFTPWFLVILSGVGQIQKTTSFLTEQYSLSRMVDVWFLNLNRVFVDRELGAANILLVVLVIYALAIVWREAPVRTRWFVVLLVGLPFLLLVIPDLAMGGQRSLRIRYLIPSYLGMQLAIAHLLTVRSWPSWSGLPVGRSSWRKTCWQAVLVVLLMLSLTACWQSSQAQVWWNKSLPKSHYLPDVAEIINQSPTALIITDDEPIHLLSFSYLLSPDTRLRPVSQPRQLPQEQDFHGAFLFLPSETLQRQLVQYGGYGLTPLYRDDTTTYLWQLD